MKKIMTNKVLWKDTLTEQEIKLLLRRKNAGESISLEKEYKLEPDQFVKGMRWLNNLRRTPNGKDRKNNPFGYREEKVLDSLTKIRLTDFYSERGTFYVPVYTAYSVNSGSFQYYVMGGIINIIG